MFNYSDKGLTYVPGIGMMYDPSQFQIERGGVFGKDKYYQLMPPSPGQDGPPQRVELERLRDESDKAMANRFAAAGTLFADNPDYKGAEALAMQNPLPGLISGLGNIQALLKNASSREPKSQPYQNPLLSQLLGML